MTDENRAKLRGLLTTLVSAVGYERTLAINTLHSLHSVAKSAEHFGPFPPLTPAQVLALSVLLGDEAVTPNVLADYLLDSGHEYAVECYERGKREADIATGSPLKVYGRPGRVLSVDMHTLGRHADCEVLVRLGDGPQLPTETTDGDGWPRWMSADPTVTPPG